MSSTLAKVRKAVRYRIRDWASEDRAIATPELNEIIQSNMRYVAGCVPLGETWVNGALGVTVTLNSDLASLPVLSVGDYVDILELRRSADGYILTKRTREDLDRLYWSSSLPAASTPAEPAEYCLMESNAQVVNLRFQAIAKSATTLDVLRRVMPSDMTADSSVVPFATLAVEAVIDLSSVEALAKLPEAGTAGHRVNPGVAQMWTKRAEDNIRHESERLARQRGVGRPEEVVP